MRICAMVDEVSGSGHRPPLPVCVGCGMRLDGEGPVRAKSTSVWTVRRSRCSAAIGSFAN